MDFEPIRSYPYEKGKAGPETHMHRRMLRHGEDHHMRQAKDSANTGSRQRQRRTPHTHLETLEGMLPSPYLEAGLLASCLQEYTAVAFSPGAECLFRLPQDTDMAVMSSGPPGAPSSILTRPISGSATPMVLSCSPAPLPTSFPPLTHPSWLGQDERGDPYIGPSLD